MPTTYNGTPDDLLTYTSPSVKLTRQSDGVYKYQAHNLYLNSAAPANQSITVVSGATYAVTITGTVSTTASGAATGTWTAGTQTFTAATTTLTFGSTSGAGTVHVRRTPSVDTYLATTGAAKYALPYEWDSSGNPLGILVEEARTNICLRSNALNDASWTIGGLLAFGSGSTADATAAPDGTTTADLLTEDTSNGDHRAFQSLNWTTGTTYTLSAYLKPNGRILVQLYTNANNGAAATFNLSTVSYTLSTGTSASITAVGNGWYRCAVVFSCTSTTAANFQIRLVSTGTTTSYTGDGTSGVYVWGAQVEAGSFATSPIQTFGATATRAADNIYIGAASFPDALATGTVFAEFQQLSPAYGQFIIGHGSASVPIFNGGASYASYDGTSEVSLAAVTPGTTITKAALSYTGSTRRGAVNGTTSGALAYDGSFSGTLWRFGSNSGVSNINGYFRKALIIPRAMTSSELQTLTS